MIVADELVARLNGRKMHVGILSDTHDERTRTKAAVQMLEAAGADVLIHCGDLVDPDLIRICSVMPLYLVFGNNDQHNTATIESRLGKIIDATCLGWGEEIELHGKRIAVTHGHLYKIHQQLLANQPDYMLTGHSHVASDKREGGTRFINPGALHRANPYTVALLNLEDDHLQFLTVPS